MTSRRILVIRPDRIGDVVLALPVFHALHMQWPDAHIAALVSPYTRDVLREIPWIDYIHTDDPAGRDAGARGFWRLTRTLRSARYDTALMLLPTVRHAWMLMLAGIRARLGVGHTLYQAATFTRTVSRKKHTENRHEADYCMDLARAIGAAGTDVSPQVFLTDSEREGARSLLDQNGLGQRPIIGIHPGNGHNAPNWSPERYAQLARDLYERYETPPVITGRTDESDLARRISEESGIPTVSLLGKLGLRDLMAVIGEMDLLVSSSTGPMHLAAALGTSTVSLFCPQQGRSPDRWRALGGNSDALLPVDGPCATCEQGPMCELEGIGVGSVVDAVARRLGAVP